MKYFTTENFMDSFSNDQMREIALRHAIASSDTDIQGDVVVKKAEVFFQFLKGEVALKVE